ncbi:MAG: C4-type zinc ribbon domain-containing protein [Candidatus Omnitrophica bacterium]|nr:C4-type zinc ribbon domain-containing protein [Candidatus Omnitrophota bacterium]
MSVAELLLNLIKLQAVDKEIFDIKRQLVEIPTRLKILDLELETANSNVKKKEDELKTFQLKRKEKEIDLETKENSIKKMQGQLYQVKTNNEYNALEKEIAGLKADKSVLEEEILGIFDRVEAAEKDVDGAKKAFAEDKKRVDAEKGKVEAAKKEIEAKLIEFQEKRKTIVPMIDKETLSRYDRILNNKDGMALVPVKGDNCGGCFVHLPPQVINEIRMKEEIVYCERCARMLFTEE